MFKLVNSFEEVYARSTDHEQAAIVTTIDVSSLLWNLLPPKISVTLLPSRIGHNVGVLCMGFTINC